MNKTTPLPKSSTVKLPDDELARRLAANEARGDANQPWRHP